MAHKQSIATTPCNFVTFVSLYEHDRISFYEVTSLHLLWLNYSRGKASRFRSVAGFCLIKKPPKRSCINSLIFGSLMFPGAFVKIPLLTTSLFSERGHNVGHYVRVNPSLHWKRKYFKNKLFKWGLQRLFNTLLQAFENDDAEDRRKLRINLQRSAQGLTLDNVFLVQYTRFGCIYLAWEGTVTLHPLYWHLKQLQPQGRFQAAK